MSETFQKIGISAAYLGKENPAASNATRLFNIWFAIKKAIFIKALVVRCDFPVDQSPLGLLISSVRGNFVKNPQK